MTVTVTNARAQSAQSAQALALSALAWTLGDADRAHRLLDLTGLSPDDLRSRADSPAVLDAVIGFLGSHEPDLIACAQALDVSPTTLMAARREIYA